MIGVFRLCNQRLQTAVEYGLRIKSPSSSLAASILHTLLPSSSLIKCFALNSFDSGCLCNQRLQTAVEYGLRIKSPSSSLAASYCPRYFGYPLANRQFNADLLGRVLRFTLRKIRSLDSGSPPVKSKISSLISFHFTSQRRLSKDCINVKTQRFAVYCAQLMPSSAFVKYFYTKLT